MHRKTVLRRTSMALEIRRGKSKWWYASFDVNGKRITQNLHVKIAGTIPADLRQEGDKEFEVSRVKAQAAHDRLREELNKKTSAQDILERIHEIKTGSKIAGVELDKIKDRWAAVPRKRKLDDHYIRSVGGCIDRLTSFLKVQHKTVREMSAVQPAHAKAFMQSEEERGVSPKTYNNTLVILRSIFKHLGEEAGMAKNPFVGIPTKEDETVHRKPFTAEEVGVVVAAAKQDDFAGPVVIAGLSTAMRKGDCCLLQWKSVDLKDGFVSVRTAKTGEFVRIPILPLFRECLEKQAKINAERSREDAYVFPEQATMYQTNPDGLTLRVKKLFKTAGFTDAFNKRLAPDDPKRQKLEGRLRRASVRDFHSLRVTWVTLALTAGVPMEMVRRVTGHRTADIVVKHYFQPGKEEFRKTLEAKLPALMGATTQKELSEKERLVLRLKSMNRQNWSKIRDQLLSEVGGIS